MNNKFDNNDSTFSRDERDRILCEGIYIENNIFNNYFYTIILIFFLFWLPEYIEYEEGFQNYYATMYKELMEYECLKKFSKLSIKLINICENSTKSNTKKNLSKCYKNIV